LIARVGERKSVKTSFGGIAAARHVSSLILLVRRGCLFGSAEPKVTMRLLHAPVVVAGVLVVLGVVIKLLLVLQVLGITTWLLHAPVVIKWEVNVLSVRNRKLRSDSWPRLHL
jgi:hypothetical protein